MLDFLRNRQEDPTETVLGILIHHQRRMNEASHVGLVDKVVGQLYSMFYRLFVHLHTHPTCLLEDNGRTGICHRS